MDTLPLSPLPSETRDESRHHRRIGSGGFVDEAVVSGVIARGAYERVFVKHEDMVLSSSEEDYAGWALPVASPFREMTEVLPPEQAPARLPAPPQLAAAFSEPGIEKPYVGGHRWWLFGMGGALTCGILTLTLLSLAQRNSIEGITAGFMPAPKKVEEPRVTASEPRIQPALTRVGTAGR